MSEMVTGPVVNWVAAGVQSYVTFAYTLMFGERERGSYLMYQV